MQNLKSKKRRKALGQHFLTNPRILNKIVKVINPQPEDCIIEIGAGKGVLTFPLAQKAHKVIAIEKDKSFIPMLNSQPFSNLTVIQKDILRVDLHELVKNKKIKLVGNLPYSISSQILFKAWGEKDIISECHFLLQKEVAERLCSLPGSKKYAPLSIIFQNTFLKKVRLTVSPGSFSPPPQVESALVSLIRREKPLFSIEDEQLFLKFLKEAFKHRRKKLSNNLKRIDISPSQIEKALKKNGIDFKARSEQVPLSKFVPLFSDIPHESIEKI